ncbi:uncharacterized protein LOC6590064 [Drosophila persimilis]|uniref:uncharacterized protein LOC6590064 n=1 Tax=Drosophila persimilis TaxID=7234 RepID=UPI000F089C80|nr:uncharacterized protein LOC6590064 [Drosophila persimilis]
MWGAEPLQKLFEGKLLLKELDQLPNIGEIFAVYDCNDGVIPRVTINDYADEGGYDAYLIDFGEHIHMTGDENIFALPDEIRLLPAEAIRCFFREGDVSHMSEFRFTRVALRVLEKCGDDLIVELADDKANHSRRRKSPVKPAAADSIQDQSVPTKTNGPQLGVAVDSNGVESDSAAPTTAKRQDPQLSKEICSIKDQSTSSCPPAELLAVDSYPDQSKAVPQSPQLGKAVTDMPYGGPQLGESDMAMLNTIDEGTSDPLKAVLGFRPKDEQGICGHYDPKLNGFKGRLCRLLHEFFAPKGVTKDFEVLDALPETEFDAPFPRKLGSIVEMQFHGSLCPNFRWLFSSGMDQE